MRFMRIFLVLAVLVVVLLIAAAAYALPLGQDEGPPTVPHTVVSRVNCRSCHNPDEHEGRTNAMCTSCHLLADTTGIPGIPHAAQGREECLACHDAGKVRPFPSGHQGQTDQSCPTCHKVALTGAVPSIPHPTQGREKCLVCHGAGKMRPFPADHRDRTNEMCALCHAAGVTGAIPTIPHPTQGREDCLACHSAGKVRPFPADHTGRTKDTCTVCHDLGVGATQQVTATVTIPTIPHPTAGREDCLVCHGPGQVKPFPADHQGRTKDTCLGCHQASAAVTPEATAAAAIPAVPHPTQGREDCLVCHGPGQVKPFPADHQGRTKDTCLGCHQISATVTPEATAAAAVPAIPHPTAGREDCLVCHGPGQVKPFPADHQGRTKDTCLGCHQAAQPTAAVPPSVQVVPTPIEEPELFAENTCVACHKGLGGASAQITSGWEQSVHAKRGVGCVSCHGGDPNQADATAAMSPTAGFLGVPPKSQIPGLCGSCHSRVDLMRPYDLPTDQFDQYWQSQHGQALLKGDQNVATCFDCHDGHSVMQVKDPASLVYPINEPAMCAKCHADQALMQPYGFPTDQYALYQNSVHGVAMLQKQDLRAPTCSTCHGKHGAAPPGFSQVANVCGQCHATTLDYYQKGAHKTGMTGQDAPGCVTCHGQHDVALPTLDLFLGTEKRRCGTCHAPDSPTAGHVDAIYQALKGADDAYAQAEAAIAQASAQHLIVAPQKEILQKANTPLIESRALQHTVSVADVQAKAKESVDLSQQAQTSAEAALKDIGTRRAGMIIALAVILVTIVALALIKRELDRDLEAKRARRHSSSV